jgi:hypothetical protein
MEEGGVWSTWPGRGALTRAMHVHRGEKATSGGDAWPETGHS